MGAGNPFAGHVPLNYQQHSGKAAEKATSYIPGETHKLEYRNQYNDRTILPRNEGCTPLRRYPNGVLDHKFVAHQVIDVVHKMKDGGNVTDFERALLTLILPGNFKELIDPKIAQTMTKLAKDERMLVAIIVEQHLREELNYNSGLGGGSVPGRSSTRS